LSFNFDEEPELKEKVEEFAKESAPCVNSPTEEKAISLLQKGSYTPYAGLFFYHLFLCELNFSKLFIGVKSVGCGGYRADEILLAIVFGLAHRLPSIEAHKLLNPSQFGSLLGMPLKP
jgi:hypothetical protein